MDADVLSVVYRHAPVAVAATCREGRRLRRLRGAGTVDVSEKCSLDALGPFARSFAALTVRFRSVFFHNVDLMAQLPTGVTALDLDGNQTLPDTFLFHLSRSEAARTTLRCLSTRGCALVNAKNPRNRYNELEACSVEAPPKLLRAWTVSRDLVAESLQKRFGWFETVMSPLRSPPETPQTARLP